MRKFSVLICILMLIGCKEDLVHLSNELDANRVLFALRDKGIEASKSSIGKEWVVKIYSADLTGALRILDEKKIFQEDLIDRVEGVSNVFQSKEEKKDVRDKDLSRSLSSSIRLIPFVKDARVHIYNTFTDPLDLDPKNDRSASVLIVHEPGEINEDTVRELVSRGAGLVKEKVSVLFVLAERRGGEVGNELIQQKIEEAFVEFSEQVELPSGLNLTLSDRAKEFMSHKHILFIVVLIGCLLSVLVVRKFKIRRKSISRSKILDKLKDERVRHEPS